MRKILQWPTLVRRDFLSLVECYKTINGLNGLDPSMYFAFASDYRQLRSNHRYKLKSVIASYIAINTLSLYASFLFG